jgi:Ser/Thr protein kinase RdoA (MazF antagonist)
MSSLATTADVDLCIEAAKCFFKYDDGYKITATKGGVNNVVQYLETPPGDKYVLRIYNNGFNKERVDYEHAVLDEVRKFPTSFRVPSFLRALKDGSTHVTLSNGMEACICDLIPGTLPQLSSARPIGKACGELVRVMENMVIDKESPNPKYFDIYKAHHATTRDNFYEYVRGNTLDICREPINYMVDVLGDLEKKLVLWKQQGLPEQLIHADLHYLNVLVLDDRVSALLDFEFAVRDWRAMELAVSLSKYAGEKEGVKYFTELSEGFSEWVTLSDEEIEAVPDMVNVRILSNVIYFVGRAIAGEDDILALTSRAQMYADRIKWIIDNRETLINMMKANRKSV